MLSFISSRFIASSARSIGFTSRLAPHSIAFHVSTTVSVEESKKLKEKKIADLLKQELQAQYVKIEDTSVGGSACNK